MAVTDHRTPCCTCCDLQGLYDAGAAGSVVFRAQPELNSCPEGSASPNGATALVLLADSSSGAAVLKRSLDGLLLLYSQASAEIRAAFHLYIGLGGGTKTCSSWRSSMHLTAWVR